MGATIDEHGLVADEYPSIETVAAALSEQFKVGPMATETEDLIYYDTFDALLRESGLTCLRRAGAVPDRDAMGDGISEAIGVRALLPQARIRARTETAPLLDELEKTVARVGVVALTVIRPGGGDHRPLPPRLWVRGVRGYDEELGAALRLLQARLPLHDAELSVHDEAVRVAGGDPAGVHVEAGHKARAGRSVRRRRSANPHSAGRGHRRQPAGDAGRHRHRVPARLSRRAPAHPGRPT